MKGIFEALARIGSRLAGRAATREYPEETPQLPARTRGRLILARDPDGRDRCVACNLCAVVCPVDCIDLAKAETADGRWYPDYFRVNMARCIFCGFCEEACPTYAIQLIPDFELAEYHRDALVYEKEHLTISGPGKYPGYCYWAVAGKGVDGFETGTGEQDDPPIDLKGLAP